MYAKTYRAAKTASCALYPSGALAPSAVVHASTRPYCRLPISTDSRTTSDDDLYVNRTALLHPCRSCTLYVVTQYSIFASYNQRRSKKGIYLRNLCNLKLAYVCFSAQLSNKNRYWYLGFTSTRTRVRE